MSGPSANPFEPPSAGDALPIDHAAGHGSAVTSVTFRVSLDDLNRAQSKGRPAVIWIGAVVAAVVLLVAFAAWPGLRRQGWTGDSIRALAFAALPVLAMLGAIGVLGLRWRGGGARGAPFETTVALDPTGLIVREEGIAELRRNWASIAGVAHDRHLIRFEYLLFDASAGRYVPQAGQIVPLRAFESEAEAAAFLATARRLIGGASRLSMPG